MFKINKVHNGELAGIHRIWLSRDGTRKANINDPKKAIGSVQGNGIWFGEPHNILVVCEGPENALDLRYHKKLKFVVSTVYSANLHSLTIPSYIELIIIAPDPDPAGYSAAIKAHSTYKSQGIDTKIIKI